MKITEFKGLPVADTVMGLDGSLSKLAFCVMGDKPLSWGLLDIDGSSTYERCGDANRKMYALLKQYKVDLVLIEDAIYVNNHKTVVQLANVFGSIMGVVAATGVQCLGCSPAEWMAHIGNPTRNSRDEWLAVRKMNPNKSTAWYKERLRQQRKQRTMEYVNERFGLNITDDNVADAIAISLLAREKLSVRPEG